MKTKVKTLSVLIASSLLFSTTAFCGDWDTGFDIDTNGNFSYDSQGINSCGTSSAVNCANPYDVAAGLNSAVDYMQKYTDQKYNDMKTYVDNSISNNTGVEKSYVDAGDKAAKTYADGKAATAESNANDYTDSKTIDLKEYVDKADRELNDTIELSYKTNRAYTDQQASLTEVKAKSYTDYKLEGITEYIDHTAELTLNDANEYSITKANEAESNANIYTDSKVWDATNDMRSYTDNSSAQTLI
ncbi:hypothetical protein AIA08_003807, partial [Salmonella enterica subsp. enterica serovar Wichita]|nr:hypothetical protein [Salmonella enterica subsp. enterica serovar Wichita]